MGKLDAASLKPKIAASIVAISSIHLLRAFMKVEQIPNDKLVWYLVIHMTFVAVAAAKGFMGKMVSHH
uniref:TIGR00645 family protein n=1 Tax=Candidatus Kentrum sp. TC TaxID=2126339 RepID=A0A450YCN7_9GAMM|nr:MAG: TIGR00645 family protein [Candidatus Kentron sp. TC]VFK55379.1 MAG: TIGR00645 family protein [Candidatus Kentron sp. TC]